MIRQKMVEDDLVECIVSLPGQLFYSTPIPASLWFLNRSQAERAHERCLASSPGRGAVHQRPQARRNGGPNAPGADGRGHRENLETYHAWRGEPGEGEYNDVSGFCASATIEEITEDRFVLTPGRYVGT
jgi:type I restriction enzyme M protein